jgi:hypothetical protein
MSYTYTFSPTQYITEYSNYSAKILSYDATTKLVTLDTPVTVSLGYNEAVGDVTSQYTVVGNITNVGTAIQQGKLSGLSSDEAGNFVGIFNVPGGTFQTGQRVFRVDNRSVKTDPTTATSYAEATFTASGLSTTSQKLEFAPSIDASSTSFTQVAQKINQLVSSITTYSPWDPVAQTFILDKSTYPNGVFITSVKLFFYSKPTTNIPVKLSIVGTLNGYPNGQKLDHSQVILTPDHVNTSTKPHYLDPSTYTEFMFDAPVYIQSGVLYAIMVEAASVDYQLYYAQQNQIAVPSSARASAFDSTGQRTPDPATPTKVGAAPYVGALFESQNSITWTADQTKDLMFVVDRCVFNTSVQPEIQFSVPKGLPRRKLGKDDIQHKIDANNVTNLYDNFIDTTWSDAVNLTTTDFVPTGTSVNYTYQATLADGNLPLPKTSVFPGKLGSPTPDDIEFADGQGQRVLLKNVDSSFSMYATLSSTDPNLSPIISDDGTTIYNIRYVINNLGISNSTIGLTNSGNGYNDFANTIATISAPDVGTDIATLGVTVANNGTANVVTNVYVNHQGSGYITTPTITISGSNTVQATAVVSGETSAHGGNALAKYYTKKVVLAQGNDSGDLRVFYTAYKPLGTEVYVYYKILNRNDNQKFDDQNWQLMTQIKNTNTYSSSKADLIEFECAPGKNGQPDNNISYVSTNGQSYTQFNQFAIKVVMAANDSTICPFLTDIRALALPSGTGI